MAVSDWLKYHAAAMAASAIASTIRSAGTSPLRTALLGGVLHPLCLSSDRAVGLDDDALVLGDVRSERADQRARQGAAG